MAHTLQIVAPMRRIIALVLAITAMLAASVAAADSSAGSPLQLAVAINAPTSWGEREAYAGTAYMGLGRRHGVRVNMASYNYSRTATDLLLALSATSSETNYDGRVQDLSIGWQFFPRSLWDGFGIETDVLVRRSDVRADERIWASSLSETESTTIAGRVMIGWSWLLGDRLMIALSAGLSHGVETGRERTFREDPGSYGGDLMLAADERITRQVTAAEGFLRFGVAFGM